MDFGVIKKHVRDIMLLLDHKYLNELEFFQQNQPSSENIACFVAHELLQRLDHPSVNISRVTAWESDDASATYIVDGQ
jgi:6-pyruvoyltetrahydropterin/6-carboxytetrahydropterin synthase